MTGLKMKSSFEAQDIGDYKCFGIYNAITLFVVEKAWQV